MPDKRAIRVRLAPSPTGEVHIGTIWIAQYNWLFAKQHGGAFIVRIEDTDQRRLVPESIERIYEALDWYGLTPDEGPRQGGPHEPYVQSQRLSLYQQHARLLVEQGSAYYCFCTPQRLQELRERQAAQKLAPRYDKKCAAIPLAEADTRRSAGESSVIRLNIPSSGSIELDDVIRGRVTFAFNQVDDAILLKSDGFPTYHLAVVVDDHLMAISHVIRGEEWLSSTPKHLFLYQAFGWPPPTFAHLPLILGRDKAKLSKRHGATSALSYRDQGYLAEAMQNFLILMGWHPKGERETVNRDEALKQFQLEDINPSGAVFDQAKLDWLNGWYIRQMSLPELLKVIEPFWHRPPAPSDNVWLQAALQLVHDRLKRLDEIDDLINFVFPSEWDRLFAAMNQQHLAAKKQTREEALGALRWVSTWLAEYPDPWQTAPLKTALLAAIQENGRTNLTVLWPLRVGLTTKTASPDVFDVMVLVGSEETQRRLKKILTQ